MVIPNQKKKKTDRIRACSVSSLLTYRVKRYICRKDNLNGKMVRSSLLNQVESYFHKGTHPTISHELKFAINNRDLIKVGVKTPSRFSEQSLGVKAPSQYSILLKIYLRKLLLTLPLKA